MSSRINSRPSRELAAMRHHGMSDNARPSAASPPADELGRQSGGQVGRAATSHPHHTGTPTPRITVVQAALTVKERT